MDINADTQIPTEMEKGGSYLIQVDAYVTAPLADLKFTATQPLGYTVISQNTLKIQMTIIGYISRTFSILVKSPMNLAVHLNVLKVNYGKGQPFPR